MQIISSIRRGANVRSALEKSSTEINEALSKTQGRIARLEVSIDSGISGAIAKILAAVDEEDIKSKFIIWVNEAGGSEAVALRRAREKINARMAKIRGEIAGFYIKSITPPLPKRTYTTIVVAVNEEMPEKIGKPSSNDRRERLAAMLKLCGNNPNVINLAEVARLFGVSRDTIYKDLENLNIKR